MTKARLALTEVHLRDDGGYVAIVRVQAKDVTAEFEVSLPPRRQRRGYNKELKHHMKPLEMLNEEALDAVVRFCAALSPKSN